VLNGRDLDGWSRNSVNIFILLYMDYDQGHKANNNYNTSKKYIPGR
jgi:hypothetical protein